MDKISVIVSVYNTKKSYLEECIFSLKEQTYKNIEIIIIDDGSITAVAELCDNIAKTDERIIVFHKINEGVSVARNYGIEKSTGKWICFVDADDWIEKDAIENLLKNAEKNDIVFSNAFIDDEKIKHESKNIVNKKMDNEHLIDALFYQDSLNSFFMESSWREIIFKRISKKRENSFYPKASER